MAWLPGYQYRKEITVDHSNVDALLSDFPLRVFVEDDSDMSTALATGYDVRFTASDGETLLKYERESWSGGGGSSVTADFWVKVASISAVSDTVIYLYWGKAGDSDGADPTNVWDANFVGVWHMTANGGTELDATSNDNDLTQSGGTIPTVTGKVGTGRDFEYGDTEVLYHADGGPADLVGADQPVTVEGWVKAEVHAMDAIVAGPHMDGNGHGQYALQVTSGGVGRMRICDEWAIANANDAVGATVMSTGTFYYLAGAYNDTDIRLYLNGALDSNGASNPLTYSDGIRSAPARTLGVGNNTDLSGRYDGVLDEVRISDIARSADWIKFTYRNISEADNEITWGSVEAESGGVAPPYRVSAGLVVLAGAEAGRQSVAGPVAGQSFTPGILAGAIHG